MSIDRRRRQIRLLLAALAGAATISSAAQPAAPSALLAPIVGPGSTPPPPWTVATLPRQTLPVTRFAVVDVDGERALAIEADASYGNLVHALAAEAGAAAARGATLAWRWRVDETLANSELRRRAGDDTNAKVCVLFDLPLARVPLSERFLVQIARQRSGENLPAATICYVWEPRLPRDLALDNAYSRRVRYLVLRGEGDLAGRWEDERREIAADFRRLFGDESPEVPAIIAVAVGADADNTQGRSRAYLTRITLTPKPASP
jgi:Protein of unknown function (DUF3047)